MPVIEAQPTEHEPMTRTRTMTKIEVQALVDAYEIDVLLAQEGIHLIVATDRPRSGPDAMPIFTGTLTKAQAQALMDAHDIQALFDGENDLQVLIQDNPTLAQAYTTIELIAKYGKP
jgi:hypothetical protein